MPVKWVEVLERSERDDLPLPLLSSELWMFVKEYSNRKEKLTFPPFPLNLFLIIVVYNYDHNTFTIYIVSLQVWSDTSKQEDVYEMLCELGSYKGLRKLGNNRKIVRLGKNTAFFPVSLPELNFW